MGQADAERAATIGKAKPGDQLGRVMVTVPREDLLGGQPAGERLGPVRRPGEGHGWGASMELIGCRDPINLDPANLPESDDQEFSFIFDDAPVVSGERDRGDMVRRIYSLSGWLKQCQITEAIISEREGLQ